MITQADIDKFKTMGKAATKQVGESYQATQLSLDYHAQYVKALKLNTQAVGALDDWGDYCLSFFKKAQGNNYWVKTSGEALSKIPTARQSLADGRKLLIADMAAHTVLSFPSASNPEAAAGEADKQASSSGRTIPKGTWKRGIDSLDPTADELVVPDEEMGTATMVGLVAAAALAAAWLIRKVM